MRGTILWVALCGCASLQATERFQVTPSASPQDVVAAAGDAAARLGLRVSGPRVEGAISDDLSPAREVTLSSPAPGTLEIHSTTRAGLGATSAALAAGTTQLLEGAELKPRITPRSLPVTLALELLEPSAAGLYLDSGDPYGRHWQHWLPIGVDALALTLVGLGLGLPPKFGSQDLVIALLEVVLIRVFATVADVPQLLRRNAAAESGFDLSQLPTPLPN